MANYATNIFYASTENEKDLDKIAKFWKTPFAIVILIGLTII